MIIDMNGRIVHYWPEVHAVGVPRLTTEGNLVYIGFRRCGARSRRTTSCAST